MTTPTPTPAQPDAPDAAAAAEAMTADEMQRAIAVALGWSDFGYHTGIGGHDYRHAPALTGIHPRFGDAEFVPDWTTDHAAALELRERLINAGYVVQLTNHRARKVEQCQVILVGLRDSIRTEGATLAEAICRAFLQAVARGWVAGEAGKGAAHG